MDAENEQNNVTLIYHDFRGMAQTCRYLLYFLNIPFTQIALVKGQKPSQLKVLASKNLFEEPQLPCLIDGKMFITNCFAIIRHLCTRAKRQDLLGQTLQERSLIRQIYYNGMLKMKKTIKMYFEFGQKAAENPSQKQQIRKQYMTLSQIMSGSLIQAVKLKVKNPKQRYIFGHITILDFLFYEQSFYYLNLFGSLQQKNCRILDTINSILGTELSNLNENSMYLRVMKEFKDNFENEPFYANNKEKLQSYGLFCPIIQTFSKQAFKKVWLGPQHFLK